MGRATYSPDDRAWLDAHPGEGLPPESPYQTGRGPGVFGQPFGAGPGVSHKSSVIPDPDDPTPEEIARAINAQFVPCSALKGARIAREIKRRELEAAGADVARRYGGDPATLSAARLRALANIHAIGSGR